MVVVVFVLGRGLAAVGVGSARRRGSGTGWLVAGLEAYICWV